MADSSTILSLLGRLKSYPKIYSLLRRGWRFLDTMMIESLRKLGVGARFGGPRGFYSGLQELRLGGMTGRVVVESQALPPLPVPSLIELAGMGQNGRQPWPIFWLEQRNTRLVGSSLAPLSNEKFLMLEAVYGEEFCRRDPSFNYLFLPRPVQLEGDWTSLVGTWSEGFYHWLTDALPRLAMLSEFPAETKILIRGPLKQYQRESLSMLGLLDRIRETSENHLLVEDYYFSSPAGMSGCTNPHVTGWLREKFLSHGAPLQTPSKFFVLRRGKTRGIRNQEEVAEFFRSFGWAVVDLEELSFADQISWFANAEAVVAEHGAGLTNLVWCSLGTKVLELCSANFINGCYEGISLCLGLGHRFEVLPANRDGRMTVPLDRLLELTQEF